MRISDWSSDVCSSDLFGTGGIIVNYGTSPEGMGDNYMSVDEPSMDPNANNALPDRVVPNETPQPVASQQASDKAIVTQIGRESCRERVCQSVEFSVVAVTLKKTKRIKERIKLV